MGEEKKYDYTTVAVETAPVLLVATYVNIYANASSKEKILTFCTPTNKYENSLYEELKNVHPSSHNGAIKWS